MTKSDLLFSQSVHVTQSPQLFLWILSGSQITRSRCFPEAGEDRHQVKNSAILMGAWGVHATLPRPPERDRLAAVSRRAVCSCSGSRHCCSAAVRDTMAMASLRQRLGKDGTRQNHRPRVWLSGKQGEAPPEGPRSSGKRHPRPGWTGKAVGSQEARGGVQRKGGCYLGVEEARYPWQQERWSG